MSDGTSGDTHDRPAGPGHGPAATQPVLERLDEAECLRLIAPGGIGRIAYLGRYGLAVFPVNYRFYRGSIVFRTAQESPTGEDLRTGIADAEYKVAFEIDDIDLAAHEGWSVLIQGPAHHMDSAGDQAAALDSGVEPWPAGEHEHAISITPTSVTGRRLRRA